MDIWISVVKDVCLTDDMVAIKEVSSVDVDANDVSTGSSAEMEIDV